MTQHEDTKTPSQGRGQDEERFQNQKNALQTSVGAPRSSNQVLKTQRDNPGRVTKNGTGSLDHEKLRGQRNNSGEREVPTFQNEKALRAELQPLKAETDNPWPGVGEDSMLRVRGVAWSNARTVMPKTEASTSRPGEG